MTIQYFLAKLAKIIHKCKGVMAIRRFTYKQNNAVLERNEALVTLFCPFQKIKHILNGETREIIHKCKGAVIFIHATRHIQIG